MKEIHGGNVYAYERLYGREPIDFSANINPLGMPPAALEAARDALAVSVRYPDPDCAALRAAIARHEAAPAAQVLCGNGAADLIYRFAYAVRPQTALVCAPAFGEYRAAFLAAGSRVKAHLLKEADGFNLTEAVLPALDGVKALCLCNPNNPTGLTIRPDLLAEVLKRCGAQGIHVLLDECFVDFLDDPHRHTMVGSLAEYPRLVILKAFTKYYAMPGLRLGYALCADAALLARMEAAGAPWSVSAVAQAAGIAALTDRAYRLETQALIQAERAFMKQMLRQLGLSAMGEANFLLLKAPAGLPAALAAEGVPVRDCASFDGLGEGWVRIAIRTRAENMRLLSRLSRCLHG